MATFFTMPKLGMNMTEGHIINWLVKEGETIKEGDPILEIETDKAANEVESPASGILAKILHDAGEDVPCNSVLAVILNEGEELPKEIPSAIGQEVAPKTEFGTKAEKSDGVKESASKADTAKTRIRISPAAKKLARELGVDIGSVVPKGSQIKRNDIQRAYDIANTSKETAPDDAVKKPFTGIRKRTGDAMAESTSQTAMVPLYIEANAESLISFREKHILGNGKISYNLLLAKLVADALIEFPYMNSQLSGNEIWEFKKVNIGIAVDSERGLIVPILKDVSKKTLEELYKEFDALVTRAKSGKASVEDLSEGTFTITNLGAFEIESFVPIINYPQCAILGIGEIKSKAVVANGKIISRQMIGLTLVFDHRIVDGAQAAAFFQKLKHSIEELD
jgi:pyruvate dehydrogenase E2 component (dihydrolipoamide acetyltransferase)